MVLINGENLNEQIVASGNGWVYRKYCTADYCNDWLKLEETARDAHVGLWADKNPQPPWEWRAEHRNGKGSGSSGNVSVVTSSAAVAPAQEGQLFITVMTEVMFFMVLPVEIITVKIALSDWGHIKRRWVQGIELIGNV